MPASAGPPRDWDPVPAEELADDSSRVEPHANAEAIFWKAWITDQVSGSELSQHRDYYVRIKIYTPEGAQKYGKIDIDFPAKQVQIDDVRARTIQPDGTIVPLDRKALLSETLVRKGRLAIQRRSFAPPALRPGCIVEYRYHEVRFGSAVLAQALDFQLDLPVRKLLYYTRPLEVPGWYVRSISFRSPARTSPVPRDGFHETMVIYSRPYVVEPHSPPPLQQRAWMLLYYTQEPLTSPEVYWPKVGSRAAKWFDEYTRPGKEAVALARRVAGEAASDAEKVRLLGEWIQRDFRVARGPLDESGLDANRNVKAAIQQGGGTHGDAGMVFATLARALGLAVRLVKVPTREEFFFDRQMMEESFVRSWQVAIRVEGQWRCYDPATRYLPWDMVLWPEEAQQALLCDADSSRFLETPIAGPERSLTSRMATLQLADDGTLTGRLEFLATGHANEDFRIAFDGVAAAQQDSTLLREAGLAGLGLELTRSEVLMGADERLPAVARCQVRMSEHATVTGKRIVLEPAVFHARRPARFTASSRRHPVYFPYAWSEQDSIRIRIPDGWRVETLDSPEPARASGVAEYRAEIRYDHDAREIVYRRAFRFGEDGSLWFAPNSYGEVKRWFDLLHERDQASVTLVREAGAP